MDLAMIGLGRMGANMTERLVRAGHRVVGYARSAESRQRAVQVGGEAATSLADVMERLRPPRVIWLMIPAGPAVDQTLQTLVPLLRRGDTVVDGGNSYYRDTLRRAPMLEERGLEFVDVGTSGGIWGRTEGYSLMIGGKPEIVSGLRTIFEALAPGHDQGWGHVGPHGAGHFVKMVHNGIEYGMMQALAEGFALMKRKKEFGLNVYEISEIWRYGSVVRSWLLDLTAAALRGDQELTDVIPRVADSGEGRWTVFEAVELDCPAPVITLALLQRLRSRDDYSYADRLLALMREQFGGHEVQRRT
ncbi:MAG: decarboxylating 6-phosphogluconate dehydrogenase [Bacillati bacterium ANGP1]|uniref:Decarboxylating 6-phosphogluconate dehydrogenase n=1 Tax=Candidatus Segetimicrobium genomatis TaxID=2569760 RepID=A0A537IYW8_9BACT|nr:MAG: decarboxylating 6-phosphogluconate dehydrogenase [Terrabacteria group bacterium ANGP1]